MNNPVISVCIPVYNTEKYLEQSLWSVVTQDFNSFEIVIVNDASQGRDSLGRTCKKIVKLIQKKSKVYRQDNKLLPVNINYIENTRNRGLIEVRRTMCYESKGKYITQLDSDDEMVPGALSVMYVWAEKTGADIIHGSSTAGSFNENNDFIKSDENRFGAVFYGELNGRDIFRKWFIDLDFTGNIWGKLVKRDIYLKAFDHIPYTECNMLDDVLVFFFLSRYLNKYVGIEDQVVRYRKNVGMSSEINIDNMQKWRNKCSMANVFTIISKSLEEDSDFKLLSDENDRLKFLMILYLRNSLIELHTCVKKDLVAQAYAMLCDYWGKDFVDEVDAALVRDAQGKLNVQSQLQEGK